MITDPDLEMELMQLAFGDAATASPELIKKVGRRYDYGELLFREGDRSRELFVILRGNVEISTEVSGTRSRLAVIGSGQILGEMSHFDQLPRSATAKSMGTVDALVLSKENFALIFQLHPKWTIQLVEGLAQRIEKTLGSITARRMP